MALKQFFNRIWLGTADAYNANVVPNSLGNKAPFDIDNAINIATVYTCIKILSGTVSRLPLATYKNDGKERVVDKNDYRYDLLHYNPNAWTTSQSFFAAIETFRNLKGNAFARIFRDNITGRATRFELVSPSRVKGYNVTNGNLYYNILVTTKGEDNEIKVNAMDMLHFRSPVSEDGIWSLNPIEAARMNLSATYKGYSTIDTFYDNNAASPKAIKSTVQGANQKVMLEALNDFNNNYAGYQQAGKILPLPPNTEIQDLALNFADAEFIDTIKFSAAQIASIYGVPPHLVGVFEASKWSTVEATMLDFKTNELAAVLKMYRTELEFKLFDLEERKSGMTIEFNDKGLIETDYKTRIDSYKQMQQMGVMTANQIAKLEGVET